ncbi:v-type proton ATPase subunit D 1 [Trichonephila clavipes]|uniref:V-type proton ATPase subunit D 1 n=1 Tax=Trichonephila clavipes TaxID=2585209 RepID=A0A8X6SDB3_TRICX|nr:v-type proton ATPase subunit D 1 [Trichonephila clavipes]
MVWTCLKATSRFYVNDIIFLSIAYELAGLARGGQQLAKLKKNYAKAVHLLVDLASLQTSFITLDEVIKVTVGQCP